MPLKTVPIQHELRLLQPLEHISVCLMLVVEAKIFRCLSNSMRQPDKSHISTPQPVHQNTPSPETNRPDRAFQNTLMFRGYCALCSLQKVNMLLLLRATPGILFLIKLI